MLPTRAQVWIVAWSLESKAYPDPTQVHNQSVQHAQLKNGINVLRYQIGRVWVAEEVSPIKPLDLSIKFIGKKVTSRYMAPKYEGYKMFDDVWSSGMTAYHIITGSIPFEDFDFYDDNIWMAPIDGE